MVFIAKQADLTPIALKVKLSLNSVLRQILLSFLSVDGQIKVPLNQRKMLSLIEESKKQNS